MNNLQDIYNIVMKETVRQNKMLKKKLAASAKNIVSQKSIVQTTHNEQNS